MFLLNEIVSPHNFFCIPCVWSFVAVSSCRIMIYGRRVILYSRSMGHNDYLLESETKTDLETVEPQLPERVVYVNEEQNKNSEATSH